MPESKFIDIHSHLQFAAFDQDRNEVLKRTLDSGTWMINVGTQYDTSKNAIDLAHTIERGVYATVGLHPIHTSKSHHDEQELGEGGMAFVSRGEEFDFNKYKELALDSKVVGIGECGLDYYRLDEESIKKQKKVFEAQVNLADEVKKPLMLHVRNSPEGGANAYSDALEIVKSVNPKIRGDVHFFAGSIDDARAFLDFGFTISFTGAITFPKSKKLGLADYEALVKYIPLGMILSETDNPYVAPVPFRGKRNEPGYVKYVVSKIAEWKGLDSDEVAATISANAQRVFKI
ncbi:MAG: TatD family hydrolase [Candidatus Vogelbacteria bacterium]|nr:TatD family hydrolase [Candidatus Vogelbacteria bacterium]